MTDEIDESYYSDAALAKQAALAALPEGAVPPLSMLGGIYEPRVHPSADERCTCCGLDARDSEGGEEHQGKRWCFICVGRGHHEDEDTPTRQQLRRRRRDMRRVHGRPDGKGERMNRPDRQPQPLDLDLDAIEARLDAAKGERWEVYVGNVYAVEGDWIADTARDEDATFIAHARTDVPALVAEVKRLRDEGGRNELEELRTEYERLRAEADERLNARDPQPRGLPHSCLPSLGDPCGDCHRCRGYGWLLIHHSLDGRETKEPK